MRREAKGVLLVRGRWALAAWSASLAVAACNKMSTEECDGLRSQGFDIINTAHVCADDSDCAPTSWPGCAKPVNSKNKARIGELKDKFDKGKCVEEKATCRDTPEIYCKQGLCVFRELAGQVNPKK